MAHAPWHMPHGTCSKDNKINIHSKKVLKLVFLVGDAPPHMDYQDDVKYPAVCEMAVKKDLIINTVQCGTMASTTPIWKKIAKLAEGKFVAIQQSGGVVAISTPYDEAITKCNGKLGSTVCAYGSTWEQQSALRKNSLALSAPSEAAADRATCWQVASPRCSVGRSRPKLQRAGPSRAERASPRHHSSPRTPAACSRAASAPPPSRVAAAP